MDWRRGPSRIYIVLVILVSLFLIADSNLWLALPRLVANHRFFIENQEAVEIALSETTMAKSTTEPNSFQRGDVADEQILRIVAMQAQNRAIYSRLWDLTTKLFTFILSAALFYFTIRWIGAGFTKR